MRNMAAALLREEAGKGLPAEAAGYLETIGNAARLLGGQIDGLMAWAKLDRLDLQQSVIDADALVREVRDQLAPECAGRQVDWQVPGGLPALRGDGALLRQLLTHLLSNALKFTRPRQTAVMHLRAGENTLVVDTRPAPSERRHVRRAFCVATTGSSQATSPLKTGHSGIEWRG